MTVISLILGRDAGWPRAGRLPAEAGGDAAEQAVQAELESGVDGVGRVRVNAQIQEPDKTGEQPGCVQAIPPRLALGRYVALVLRFRLALGLVRPQLLGFPEYGPADVGIHRLQDPELDVGVDRQDRKSR